MATKALLVAGAHHRVGSELLTRLLRVVCRAVARRKSACVIDAETSALQPTPLNASALVALHARRGVRLVSSGRWSLALSDVDAHLAAAGIPWRFVHFVRPPLEVVVSSYLYHLSTTEPWAHVRSPPWAWRMHLQPPIAHGYSYVDHLNTLNRTVGVQLQAQHSLRLIAAMVAVAEDCASRSPTVITPSARGRRITCTNLWLEGFSTDFDRAARAFLSALGLAHAATDEAQQQEAEHTRPLLASLRRAGHLSEGKARTSRHVTRGKDELTRAMLMRTLRASAYGPMLQRLGSRLEAAMRGAGAPPQHASSAAARVVRPHCVWRSSGARGSTVRGSAAGWWSTDEPVRQIVAPHDTLGGSDQLGSSTAGAWSKEAGHRGRRNNRTRALTTSACCELCRAAVDPGCLFFNYRSSRDARSGRMTTRCVLLSSRVRFHSSPHSLSGEA